MPMNLISNDCVGGYLYKNHLNTDFQNPFIWSSIDLNNFCKVIELYDKIDFFDFECKLEKNESGICKKDSLTPKITIMNEIDVNFFHYIYDVKVNVPQKVGPYTLSKSIIAYTTEAYKRRLEKMKEKPIFIWDTTKIAWYNKNKKDVYQTFKELNSNFTIIIYDPNVKNDKIDNIILLNKTNGSFEVDVSAKNIYNNIIKNM